MTYGLVAVKGLAYIEATIGDVDLGLSTLVGTWAWFTIATKEVARGSFRSSMRAAWRSMTREVWSMMAISASSNWVCWRLGCGHGRYLVGGDSPVELLAHLDVLDGLFHGCLCCPQTPGAYRSAVPTNNLPMFRRPPSRPFMAYLKPSPSLPIRFLAGTTQSSKMTAACQLPLVGMLPLVGCEFHPSFFSFFPKLSPGNPFSTTKLEIPLGPEIPDSSLGLTWSAGPGHHHISVGETTPGNKGLAVILSPSSPTLDPFNM